jgi:hypothetical protein
VTEGTEKICRVWEFTGGRIAVGEIERNSIHVLPSFRETTRRQIAGHTVRPKAHHTIVESPGPIPAPAAATAFSVSGSDGRQRQCSATGILTSSSCEDG